MAVAYEAPSPLAPWVGLVGGLSAASLYTWNQSWGDPWLAAFGGSTSRLDASAPAAWTANGLRDQPESWMDQLRSAGWDYAYFTGAPPSQQRVDAQAAAGESKSRLSCVFGECREHCFTSGDPLGTGCAGCVAKCSAGGVAGAAVTYGPYLLIVGAVVLAVLVLK